MIFDAMTGISAVGLRLRKNDPNNFVALWRAFAGIHQMKLMAALSLVQFIDNGWSFAAMIVVLAFWCITRPE